MRSLDPATRKVTWLGLELAGALIWAAQRRAGSGTRRTPDRLLLEDGSGMPGPALVEPVVDYDMVLPPAEVDRAQAKELALAAGKIALRGVAGRLLGAGRRLVGGDRPDRERVRVGGAEVVSPAEEPAERAAWERFVVALERVADLRAAYAIAPDEVAAEDLRWAEVELEDAVAIAGEFEVKKIRWLLT
jgi:hypothetical protein